MRGYEADEIRETRVLHINGAIVTVNFPKLDEDERQRRLERLKEACRRIILEKDLIEFERRGTLNEQH